MNDKLDHGQIALPFGSRLNEPSRERYGFARTVCGCEICRVPCRHMPGSLDVADLEHLCPADHDVFAWATEHLRALTSKPVPTLVPVRLPNGHCHWLFAGQCVVHQHSPYGCSFFDAHQPPDEVERRSAAVMSARREDAERQGLYYRVWVHLCRLGLTAPSGDRDAVDRERQRIRLSLAGEKLT